jgi:hypothetical protein
MGKAQPVERWDGSKWVVDPALSAYVYTATSGPPSDSVVFLESTASQSCLVRWGSANYTIATNSSLIVAGDGTLVFDTNAVPAPSQQRSFTPLQTLSWSYWTDASVVAAPHATAPPVILQPGQNALPWTNDSTVRYLISDFRRHTQ